MKTIHLSTQTISANILKCHDDASFKPEEKLHNVFIISESNFLVNFVLIFLYLADSGRMPKRIGVKIPLSKTDKKAKGDMLCYILKRGV